MKLEEQYTKHIESLVFLIRSGYTLQSAAEELGINKTSGISYFSKRYFEETGKKLIDLKPKKDNMSASEKLSNQILILYKDGLNEAEIAKKLKRSKNIITKYLKIMNYGRHFK